jgi:hypothetical protein
VNPTSNRFVLVGRGGGQSSEKYGLMLKPMLTVPEIGALTGTGLGSGMGLVSGTGLCSEMGLVTGTDAPWQAVRASNKIGRIGNRIVKIHS